MTIADFRTFAVLAAGAVWPLAFAPFGWWPLALVSLFVLFAVLDGATPRAGRRYGYLFGLGLFGAGVWWVFVSIHDFGGLHWSLAGAITVVLIAVLALFTAGFGWLAARWLPARTGWRWLAGLPALWILVEWLRGWLFSGFPWLTAGYAFSDTPLGAYAPVGGVLLVSLAAAVTVGALGVLGAALWPRFRHRGSGQPSRPEGRSHGATIGALVVIAATWTGGVALERVQWSQPAGEPLSVALLQGNVTQDLKWEPAQLLPTMRLYHRMTEENLDADVIVWPEAALPALKYQLDEYLESLDALARGHGAAVVMGILVWEAADDRYFNSVLSLGDGAGLYHKRHLVPFGEFFPVPDMVRNWLRLMNLPYSDFTRGPGEPGPLTAAGRTLGASICYEVAYGASMIRALPEAEMLVNVSNDAWFGATIAPHQHLQIARFRAREAGRWMLRATNTGITAVIGPDGRVQDAVPQFEAGVLRAEAVPMAGMTPYARVHDWPVLLSAALLFGLAGRLRYS